MLKHTHNSGLSQRRAVQPFVPVTQQVRRSVSVVRCQAAHGVAGRRQLLAGGAMLSWILSTEQAHAMDRWDGEVRMLWNFVAHNAMMHDCINHEG